jgi:hypothetical protein
MRRVGETREQLLQRRAAESLAIRLAAGCRRICNASNDSTLPTGMTSSPSNVKRRSGSLPRAATISGK